MVNIRCFIGFFVHKTERAVIAGLQKSIESLPLSCKLVEPENLHVCLSFLGGIKENEVDAVAGEIGKICSENNHFEANVGKIKLIPTKNYVRVIALEVSSKSGILEKISSEIKERVGGSVKPPHITLCRVKRVSDKEKFLAGIEGLASVSLKFVVDSVSLIKSELLPDAPKYNIVKVLELRK